MNKFIIGRLLAPMGILMSVAIAINGAMASLQCCYAQSQKSTPRESADLAGAYFASHFPEILQEYADLLRLPNVSANLDDVRANAHWIVRALEKRQVQARVVELPGVSPVVLGRLAVGAPRTLGIYVHYDGQPVEISEWLQSPWQPTLYTAASENGGVPREFPEPGETFDPEWRLYARSAADDKAPIAAILAALDAMHASGRSPGSNLVFFFEGEEEAGSDHLGHYMDQLADELKVDLWIIADGPSHQSRRPQLVFGVRGYTAVEITVHGANRYLHSGNYGNWAPNPASRLASLLASMKGVDGEVMIEGFYDTVAPIEAAVTEAAKSIPPFEAQLRRELGLHQTEMHNAPFLERILLPSLNIRSLQSATVGETARNVIPPTATAAIDIRLVKGNDPEKMLDLVEEHIRRQGFHLTHDEPTDQERASHALIAQVKRQPGYPAVRTSMQHPLSRWLQARIRVVAGEELVLMPTLGGSLPLYLFEEKLEKPLVILPIVNHDNNQHAPNENLRLGNLEYGVRVFASIFAAD